VKSAAIQRRLVPRSSRQRHKLPMVSGAGPIAADGRSLQKPGRVGAGVREVPGVEEGSDGGVVGDARPTHSQ
jgi:hypothetical protein